MIMDDFLEFADAVSVVGSTGTALIGDVIDLGAVQRDVGLGEAMYLVITVDTEIITGGSAGTIKFQLVSDSTSTIATDGSASVHWDSGTFVTDGSDANDPLLKQGQCIACIPVPAEGRAFERYLGILCTIATQATTAGKINAFLTKDQFSRKVYSAHTGY